MDSSIQVDLIAKINEKHLIISIRIEINELSNQNHHI